MVMRFKLWAGSVETWWIDRDVYLAVTNRDWPFLQGDGDVDDQSKFAVCPGCNCPIRMVGLGLDSKVTPHGRHCGEPVVEVGEFDLEALKNCIYRRKRRGRVAKEEVSGITHLSVSIAEKMFANFDHALGILEEDLGIEFSMNTAKKLLTGYLAEKGNRYVHATLENIPWVLGYANNAHWLLGQKVGGNEVLTKAVLKRVRNARVDAGGKLVSDEGRYVGVKFCFVRHDIAKTDEGETVETLAFRAFRRRRKEGSGEGDVIWSCGITMRPLEFERRIRAGSGRGSWRSRALMEMAADIREEWKHRLGLGRFTGKGVSE